jgi:hypothetical protein
MKKNNLIIGFSVAALLMFCYSSAQAQVNVTKGSTHRYSVSPLPGSATYDYHWSVTPGGTSSTFGTADTSDAIVWDGAPGTYTITIYPTKPVSGCAGNNQTLIVNVIGMSIAWSATSSTQCPRTDNQTGDFSVVANYTGVTGAWSFSYIIDSGTEQTVNVASGNSSTVNITGFTNTSNTAAATHTIHITSVTTPDNYTVNYTGTEPDAATRLYTVTVESTPGTSGIIQL